MTRPCIHEPCDTCPVHMHPWCAEYERPKRFSWIPPLLILAALLCCLIAYAREQAREEAEWASVMDEIPRQMREAAR